MATKSIFRFFKILITISLFLMILFIIFEPIDTVFNITAETESVEILSYESPVSGINVYNADLFTYAENEDYELELVRLEQAFNGMINLSDSLKIKFERVSNGKLYVEFEKLNDGFVGQITGSSGDLLHNVQDILFLEIDNIDSLLSENHSLVFPVSGSISIGESIDVESNNEFTLLLHEGDITLTGITRYTKSVFPAGSEEIYLGDKLKFEDSYALGFITVNNGMALQISYRSIDQQARIIKPGPKDSDNGYHISASLFSRFKNDRIFQVLSIFIAFFLATVSVADFLLNLLSFEAPKGNKERI